MTTDKINRLKRAIHAKHQSLYTAEMCDSTFRVKILNRELDALEAELATEEKKLITGDEFVKHDKTQYISESSTMYGSVYDK